jgi:predicted regulator of Ras-like GTPase activity (Roadblock/LC7/MglB family)
MAESEAILENIGRQPGVLGTMVMSNSGIPIRATFSPTDAAQYAALVANFLTKARADVGNLVPGENIQVIMVRSFKNELFIIPDANFSLVVVQDSQVSV